MLEILTGNIEMMILIKLAFVAPIIAVIALILKYERNTIIKWVWDNGIPGTAIFYAMFATPYYLADYTSNTIVLGLSAILFGPFAAMVVVIALQHLIASILRLPKPDSFSETPDLGTWPPLPDGQDILDSEDQF